MITKEQILDHLQSMKQFLVWMQEKELEAREYVLDSYLIHLRDWEELKAPQSIEFCQRKNRWEFGDWIGEWEEDDTMTDYLDWHYEIPFEREYESVEEALPDVPGIARRFEAMVDAAIAEASCEDYVRPPVPELLRRTKR
jgi:hypothetical protein